MFILWGEVEWWNFSGVELWNGWCYGKNVVGVVVIFVVIIDIYCISIVEILCFGDDNVRVCVWKFIRLVYD